MFTRSFIYISVGLVRNDIDEEGRSGLDLFWSGDAVPNTLKRRSTAKEQDFRVNDNGLSPLGQHDLSVHTELTSRTFALSCGRNS